MTLHVPRIPSFLFSRRQHSEGRGTWEFSSQPHMRQKRSQDSTVPTQPDCAVPDYARTVVAAGARILSSRRSRPYLSGLRCSACYTSATRKQSLIRSSLRSNPKSLANWRDTHVCHASDYGPRRRWCSGAVLGDLTLHPDCVGRNFDMKPNMAGFTISPILTPGSLGRQQGMGWARDCPPKPARFRLQRICCSPTLREPGAGRLGNLLGRLPIAFLRSFADTVTFLRRDVRRKINHLPKGGAC